MVDTDAVGDVPLHMINNYFSIGADAHVALEFHLERSEKSSVILYQYQAI